MSALDPGRRYVADRDLWARFGPAALSLDLADLPERIELVRRRSLGRRRAGTGPEALRQAAQDGQKQAAIQLEVVKARHAALQKARAERLAAVTAEPDQVRLGEIHFIAHALIVPSVEEEDAKRFDAEVEAVAVKLATAHEENLGAKVRDVSMLLARGLLVSQNSLASTFSRTTRRTAPLHRSKRPRRPRRSIHD